jgi:peptide/nickel transport system permease protein
MWRLIAGRAIGASVALLALSLVAFSMVHLLPGNLADAYLGPDATPAARHAIVEHYGLNKPLPIQYLTWLANASRGDLGETVTRESALNAIMRRAEPSISLAFLGIGFAVFVALALGTVAGLRRNSLLDRIVISLAVVFSSIPDFVLGLILILFVAIYAPILPTFGYVSITEDPVEWIRHLVLPAFALSAVLVGLLTRLTRSTIIETLSQEYVRTARGKGLSYARVILWHVVRPSLIPIVTTAGLYFVAAIPGVVVVEVLFGIPGVGRLLVDAVGLRDFAVIQGATLLIGGLAIVVSFLVDLSYRILDPRTRAS